MMRFLVFILTVWLCTDFAYSQLAELISENHRYKRQAGSSRLGDPCTQNIDCTTFLLYCTSGRCACSSSATQINNVCYAKVYPGQSGCTYTEQCTATWPRSTCSSGTCICPTTSSNSGGTPTTYYAAATRDGFVCVATAAAGTTSVFNCPLPDYITTASPQINSFTSIYNSISTQASCTGPGACSYTPTGASGNVQDVYDCVQTSATATAGVCCPTRALTCIQPPLSGGSGGTTTRYYYNSVAGTCSTFSYSATSATFQNTNGNNFETQEHCITYCADTCERGHPEYIGTSANSFRQCSASSDNCGTNYECDRVGSNYLCCGKPEYICGLNGGRDITRSAADPGFYLRPGLVVSNTRYFFNPNTASCISFTYNGAGGNFNNFFSSNDCSLYCEKELCTYGEPLKQTNGQNQRCSGDSDCPTSYQCTSSSGASSIQICCPLSQTICEGVKIIGTCSTYVTRLAGGSRRVIRQYWYNAATGECESFQYSGCGGTSNNFRSQLDCQTACQDTTAAMTCIQGLPYKDSQGRYFQCQGVSTGFGNVGTVTSNCPSNYDCYFDGFRYGCCPKKAYTCSLSSDSGRTCTTATSRWYWDTTNRRCTSFTYFGCDGNPNNFASQSLCQSYCGVGGCDSGGPVFIESGTSFPRTCSLSVTCPSGYVCEPINLNGNVANRCCPTRDTVCSGSPITGNCIGSSNGNVNLQRYYFNRVTRSCQTFNYQGCEASGNNFATMAQCLNYCRSAGCQSGEIVYINPSTNQPQSCSTSLTSGCPTGYSCRYDGLTQASYCCGAGVCLPSEKAFMNALTQEPQSCQPGLSLACPVPYQCTFNQRDGKYYCCSPASGQFCPTNRAPFNLQGTTTPQPCQVSLFSTSGCPVGYSCQTAAPGSSTGYCCSASDACPNGGTFETNLQGNAIPCTIGSLAVCGGGFSCQTAQSGTTAGFCCSGTNGAVQGGCPPNQYQIPNISGQNTCNPFGTVASTQCPSGSTCQFSNINNQYQCCSSTPPNNVVSNSNGCPATQVAYLENGQPRICPSVGSNVCPTGYFCQFSTINSRFQCCGVNGGCPNNQVAQISTTGAAQPCTAGISGCQTGYTCVPGRNGGQICCSSGQATNVNCQGDQVLYNGACVPRVPAGQSCAITEQCLGGSFCINAICQCPAGQQPINGICSQGQVSCQFSQVQVNGQCLNRVLPDQPCQDTRQCQGGSSCQGGICRCPVGQTNFGGYCTQPITQAPLAGYCTTGSVYADNGTPRSCLGNSYGCPTGYSCAYSAALRNYYCCGSGGGFNNNNNNNAQNDCANTQALLFPSTNQPVTCNISPNNCPSPYTCVFSASSRQNKCCRF